MKPKLKVEIEAKPMKQEKKVASDENEIKTKISNEQKTQPKM